MNKHQAAEALGIKPRTLELWVKQGRIAQQYVKGKTRDVADFTPEEVERVQREMAAAHEAQQRHAVLAPEHAPETEVAGKLPRATPLIVLTPDQLVEFSRHVAGQLVERLAPALPSTDGADPKQIGGHSPTASTPAATAGARKRRRGKGAPAVSLSERLLLTVPEAARQLGAHVTPAMLTKAIAAGKLKATTLAGKTVIKRDDLIAYVKKL